MSKRNKFISVTRNSKGDLVLELNPAKVSFLSLVKVLLKLLLRVFTPIFSFFDFLASKKKLVISAVGLGIGLGLSVLVTQQPYVLQAFPQLSLLNSFKVKIDRVVIPSIDLSAGVTTGNVQDLVTSVGLNTLVHDERSAEVGAYQPVVIADVTTKNILKNLEAVKIGDEIEVMASNNAVYKYRVIEIREMKAEYLANVIGAYREALIIYKAKNLLRTRLYIVIAKPVK